MEKRIEGGVEAVVAFVLAGAAVFTLRNPVTGGRFTFRVRKGKGESAPHFVSVLTGEDNTSDYSYLGCIFSDGRFVVTRKSRISADAPSARAFAWAWRRLSAGRDITGAELWHCGRCARCGRLLTVPESVESGFGPECASRLGIAVPARRPAREQDDRHLDLDDSVEADRLRDKAAFARLEAEQERAARDAA